MKQVLLVTIQKTVDGLIMQKMPFA